MSRSQGVATRVLAGTFVFAFTLGAAPPGSLGNNAVYQKMLGRTVGINSLVADIEVHTHMRSFPPASFTFHGHSYFKAPDKQAVVFDDVPGLMRGLVKDSPSIAPVQVWPQRYEVTFSDDGTNTTFHLVPKGGQAAIASADVEVTDATGLVTRYTFINQNGSKVTTEQTYERIGPHRVVVSQIGQARGHGYDAAVTTRFWNYRFNVPVSDSVFEQQ